MIPLNKEHIEAQQEAQNAKKAILFESLSEEEKARFLIVEECCVKMQDAGILFFLFPCFNPQEANGFWQYNSMGATFAVDENGEIDRGKLSQNNHNFIFCVLATLFKATPDKNGLIDRIEYVLFNLVEEYKNHQ